MNGEKETLKRCAWSGDTGIYAEYHDREWGVPEHDERKLFEMLLLESFQAGLAWITVLRKREAFRKAFDNFEPEKIAAYDEEKVRSLLQDAGIIRSERKIRAVIENARIFLEMQREFGSFGAYLWGFVDGRPIVNMDDRFPTHTDLSDRISADLKRRGMRYMGSIIVYSYLQAIGVVNDHETGCFRHDM